MVNVKESILLNASPESVWRFVIDPEKLMQWRTDIERFERIQEGTPAVGHCFFIEKDVQGVIRRFTSTIVKVEACRTFACEAEAPGFARLRTLYELIPERSGCRFTVNETVDVHNRRFLKPLLDTLFLQRELHKTIRGFLETLKVIVEDERTF